MADLLKKQAESDQAVIRELRDLARDEKEQQEALQAKVDELIAEVQNLKEWQKVQELVVERLKEAAKRAGDQREAAQHEFRRAELVMSCKR